VEKNKIVKLEVSKNYIIESYKKPNKPIKYVSKEIVDKQGFRNLAKFAVIKDPETNQTKTVITSLWRPANKPSAKRLLKYYLKNYPKKVKFLNQEIKEKYLKESQQELTHTNRSLQYLFELNLELELKLKLETETEEI